MYMIDLVVVVVIYIREVDRYYESQGLQLFLLSSANLFSSSQF